MGLLVLNDKEKNNKQVFFRLLKKYDVVLPFKRYFSKCHNISFDKFIITKANSIMHNFILKAFYWYGTDKGQVWNDIYNEIIRYEQNKTNKK